MTAIFSCLNRQDKAFTEMEDRYNHLTPAKLLRDTDYIERNKKYPDSETQIPICALLKGYSQL